MTKAFRLCISARLPARLWQLSELGAIFGEAIVQQRIATECGSWIVGRPLHGLATSRAAGKQRSAPFYLSVQVSWLQTLTLLLCRLQDYIFPEEAGAAPNLKLLEAAQRWKEAQAAAAAGQ